MYRLPQPRPQTSWKSWGGVQTEEAAREEMARIGRELASLSAPAAFLPVLPVSSPEQAARVHQGRHDAVLLYACTGSGPLLTACFAPRDTLVFVRHRSGPVYYWYEALSSRYLGGPGQPHPDDVVVDDYAELALKLRGLAAARNLAGTRIVALGGAGGKYAAEAPVVAREKLGIEILETGYEAFAPRLRAARSDAKLAARAEESARRYLALPGTSLKTQAAFVTNAFLLHHLFRQLMTEHQASAFTIRSCMSTIIPMAETTACLTLSLMNDEGLMAFCESDFVIVPAAILLRHASGLPVFLHNSTFPHNRMVTCAHCTAPRRMNAREYYPASILTHYESEYGAAPKVDMPRGQRVTFINPEYSTLRWLGFRGVVRENPHYEICRSQQDVEIDGDWQALKAEARDSHWVMAAGDHLAAAGYAARKAGVRWVELGS
ncbi:MAG: sugar isomerase [Bryobacteraceae bacterium]